MASKIIFASSNKHKLAEIKAMLPERYELMSLEDMHYTDEIEETGATLEENAAIKAGTIYDVFGITCFADDSGLEVEVLDGQPGVKSARYSGVPVHEERNIELLLRNLDGQKNRRARFRTVICLKMESGTFFFEGSIPGYITEKPRGNNGFGYDPVFQPEGYTSTFAELMPEEKNKISHRKIALRKMVDFLQYV